MKFGQIFNNNFTRKKEQAKDIDKLFKNTFKPTNEEKVFFFF